MAVAPQKDRNQPLKRARGRQQQSQPLKDILSNKFFRVQNFCDDKKVVRRWPHAELAFTGTVLLKVQAVSNLDFIIRATKFHFSSYERIHHGQWWWSTGQRAHLLL